MGKIENYIIPFVGLSIGEHVFKFEIKDSFFENIEYSEIKKGNLIVDLLFKKQSSMLILEFHILGTVKVMCDRCTDIFDLPIESNERLIIKIGGDDIGDNDDVISIPTSEYEINLAQYIYEFIALALPSRRVHPVNSKGENGCDMEVIKKLEKIAVHNQEITDPRWEILKNLKLK